jgi:hypothetical protein
MQRALFAIYGEAVKGDVLDRLRQTTSLPIPQRGPLSPTRVPEGFDSDADCEPPQGEPGRQLSLAPLACREQATALIRCTFVTTLEDWSDCSLWLNNCFLPPGGRSTIWSNFRFKPSRNRLS